MLPSRFLFPFPSLQPSSGKKLGTSGEPTGIAGQGKGRSCRINIKMLPRRARKDKEDANYLDQTVKRGTGETCQLGCDRRRCPAAPGLSLGRA